MNKIKGLGIGAILFLSTAPLFASDYTPYSLYGDLEASQRQNRERVEATRRIGERDTTGYIIGTDGRPSGYTQQDSSGNTSIYDQRGRWTGQINR